jgi:NADH-quinone oxidoreductase subunit H
VPFDLPEAESELVSGYNTEYSGMKFALFFLAEYASLFAMSTLTAIFFFGGYYSPIGGLLVDKIGLTQFVQDVVQVPGLSTMIQQLEMINWLLIKTYFFIFFAMWLRATLPRLKPDQLMGFSWKFLIPLSLINVFLIAFQKMWASTGDITFGIIWAVVLIVGVGGFISFMSGLFNKQLQARIAKS